MRVIIVSRALVPKNSTLTDAKRYLENPNSIDSLASISILLGDTPQFHNSAIDYGMPDFAFIQLEVFDWFAMTKRSGCNTYYEVVSSKRSQLAKDLLSLSNAKDLLHIYSKGIGNVQQDDLMDEIDTWVDENENEIMLFLANNIRENKAKFMDLFA